MANIQGLFRLGRDAEVRFTPGGDAVANLALAFNHGKKSDNLSQWVDATIWGKRAEALAPYLIKGQQVFAVIDDPHIQTYQKRDGGESFKLVGKVSNIEFAGPKPQQQEQQAPQRTAQQHQNRPAAPRAADPTNLADMEDDLPPF